MGVLSSILLLRADASIPMIKMNEIMFKAIIPMMKPTAEANIVLPKPSGFCSFEWLFVVSIINYMILCYYNSICKDTKKS